MSYSEEELAELMKNNPGLKLSKDGQQSKSVPPGNPLPRYAAAVSKVKESEAEFQTALIDLCHVYHYRVCEFRKAVRLKKDGTVTYRTPFGADGVGYPDLFVAHPVTGNSFYVECKSDTGRLSREQGDWIDLLRRCDRLAFVWRPAMWDELTEIVKALAEADEGR